MSRMFTPEPSLPSGANAAIPSAEPVEFEFVLGRRQVASVSLVALTALAIFTSAAYMVGKSTVPAPPAVEQPVQVIVPQPLPERVVEAPLPEASVFGVPEQDHRYIQLGSVERGFAVLMVHGARKVGYPAIAAVGTNPNVFRVLVGPLDDKVQYETARAMFESMGLDTFMRKYAGSTTETPEP